LITFEIKPHFIIELLHRTVKDFLHSKDESGPFAFNEVVAEELIRDSMKTHLELVLTTIHTTYYLVPSGGSKGLEETARADNQIS
jgi:hypothetical protein